MESSAGPSLGLATPSLANSHLHTPLRDTSDRMNVGISQALLKPLDLAMDGLDATALSNAHLPTTLSASLHTPSHISTIDPFPPSDLRDTAFPPDHLRDDISQFSDVADMNVANSGIPALAQAHVPFDVSTLEDPFTESENQTQTQTQYTTEEEEVPVSIQAYAKLCFPDGDFHITSTEVIIGRDINYWRRYMTAKKSADRAQQALDEYALEPSQPSQPGDLETHGRASSKSSQSAVDLTMAAISSNFSESGGVVYYPATDEEETSRRFRRQRRILRSNASTVSVAPASLHPNMSVDVGGAGSPLADGHGANEPASSTLVYIHPANPDDIRLISKQHLRFSYNPDDENWELTVLGNRAFVNNELHAKGATISLAHGDEIIVTSVSMYFKLPEDRHSPSPRQSNTVDLDDSEDIDDLADETPIRSRRRRASSVDSELSELDDEDVEEEPDTRPKPTIKISLKKKSTDDLTRITSKERPTKHSGKTIPKSESRAEPESQSKSPETSRRVEKGKRPMSEVSTEPKVEVPEDGAPDFSLQSAEGVDLSQIQQALQKDEVSPAVPPPAVIIEPGSIFEGVAAEELPQKRKGPGRPPKNGLISKRDQSFVKRKIKDYEKAGVAPPPMDELVTIVRAENKAKELAAKAASRGDVPPDMAIMPSIELDPSLANLGRVEGGGLGDGSIKINATASETPRKASPKPKRVNKSPSPMRPETDYTEDELKKPTVTYVHILDEVLRDHPTGKADLQEIYDRICKRYPYFKYRVSTAGWQSSVRHNLLQHDRFVESGRSGKGRLWTINFDCPIDKEKKRRVTPPPRPNMAPMQNGSFGQQYGQPGYNAHFGHANGQSSFNNMSQNGSGGYYSPYGPGQAGAYNQARQPGGNMPGQNTGQGQQYPQQQQPNGGHHQSQTQQPPRVNPNPPGFQAIVNEIVHYRTQYLAPFSAGSPEFLAHEALFSRCTVHISNIFHGTPAPVDGAPTSAEELKVHRELQKIFDRHPHLQGPAGGGPSTGAPSQHVRQAAPQSAAPAVTASSGPNGNLVQPSSTQPASSQPLSTQPAAVGGTTQPLPANPQSTAAPVGVIIPANGHVPQGSATRPPSTPGIPAQPHPVSSTASLPTGQQASSAAAAPSNGVEPVSDVGVVSPLATPSIQTPSLPVNPPLASRTQSEARPLPLNSEQQPIVISDSAESTTIQSDAAIPTINPVANPSTAGVKRTADEVTGLTENEAKRVKP